MDTLTYKLISQFARSNYELASKLGEKITVLGIPIEIALPVLASVITFCGAILYNNYRENTRISTRLEGREDYFLWFTDYLINVIPIQISDFRGFIEILQSHKIRPYVLGGNVPFDSNLLGLIHDQDMYDALVKRREASREIKKRFYGLLQLHLSNLRTIKEGSLADFKRFELLSNTAMDVVIAKYNDLQLYHDELTKEVGANTATERSIAIYQKIDPIVKSWDDDHSLEDDLLLFIDPLIKIGMQFADLRLLGDAREAKYQIQGFILLLDNCANQFSSFCDRLEEARQFLAEEIPKFTLHPVKAGWLQKFK